MSNLKYSQFNKEKLEKLKLASEVRDINRPFIIRYFSSIAVIFITSASLFMGFYTGLFDAKRENLELDIRRFQSEKTYLENSVDSLKSKLDNYTTHVNILEDESKQAKEEEKKVKEQLENSKNEQQKQIEAFEKIKGQSLEDKEKINQMSELINTYEKSSTQNISTINSLTNKLRKNSQSNFALEKYIKNNIGKVVVLNNTSETNFNAIYGQVVDENEIPIQGAKILFKKSSHGPYIKESDENGKFFIKFKYDNKNKGRTFPIIISKEGYVTVNGYIVVGSTVKIKIKKTPSNI